MIKSDGNQGVTGKGIYAMSIAIIDNSDPEGLRDAAHRRGVIDSMHGFVESNLDLLLPVEKSWQPSDFLPDLSMPNWKEEIQKVRDCAQSLTDDLLVVLVGDMITEEALPSYQTMLNRFDGIGDESGISDSPWAKWSRGWTAEENRHGDLLNRYLALIGRVNIRSIEVTIHHLIARGFSIGSNSDPYEGFIYTSFQERATKISHRNVSRIAKQEGDENLHKICSTIANDEARHEEAYKRFMDKIFEIDPERAVLAFRKMMKTMVKMPAARMTDGEDPNIYEKFATVAQRLNVYTSRDYADIIDHLVARWKLTTLGGISGEAAKAQDFLCGLADRYRKLADRAEKRVLAEPPMKFSWIFNRAV
jgi:acyl-[acyl-carrier-protein] desaturase